MKRVIIVGAGPCGLVALKEMLEAGHQATVLESRSHLGGVFASDGNAYPGLHLTISNWTMAFSDFPDRQRLCYPTAPAYLEYLKEYASHFDLEKHIRYDSKVERAYQTDVGVWKIDVRSGGEINSLHSDALIVATGANHVPKPLPTSLNGFNGRVIHSSQYDDRVKQVISEKKMKVLVIGGGESGADISAELGQLSPSATVWLRHWPCVAPRYLTNLDEMAQIKANMASDVPANGFLEAVTTNRLSAGQNVNIYGFFRRLLWSTPILNSTLCRVCLNSTAKSMFRNDQAQYITKNSRMIEALHRKQIRLVISPSARATGKIIRFEGASEELDAAEFDMIVNCTGFQLTFPWLEADIESNPRSWYMHCFPPGLGDRLFLVGYARPHQGGIPAMGEMLSRYIALILSGERQLPPDYAAQACKQQEVERSYYHLSPDLHTLVDYNSFIESVARKVGCEPRLPWSIMLLFNIHLFSMLLLGIQLFVGNKTSIRGAAICAIGSLLLLFIPNKSLITKWWVFPHFPAWYRQRGPGAKPEECYALLDRVTAWKNTAWPPGFWLWLAYSMPLFYIQRCLLIVGFLAERLLSTLGLDALAAHLVMLRPKIFALHNCSPTFLDLLMP